MSLQNLLKVIAELFSPKNLRNIVISNFREVMIIIGTIGLIIIIIIIFALTGKCSNPDYIDKDIHTEDDASIETTKPLDELLVSPDDLILPKIKSFDITNDYEEFLPGKKFTSPSMDVIVKDYDKIINDTIEESYEFNFEKRKKIK